MKPIISILIFLLLLPAIVFADEGHDMSLSGVVEEIMLVQGVNSQDKVDCEKVSDEQFEELGEAVMGAMHPDPEEHEAMDQMMGGEGSDSLLAMHIAMGQRYLGCNSTGSGMMGGMMGLTGMAEGKTSLGSMTKGGDSMMGSMIGSFGAGLFGWVFMVLFWLLVVVGIVALIKLLTGQSRNGGNNQSALNILKERYARGEIDKKEFDEKKNNLS